MMSRGRLLYRHDGGRSFTLIAGQQPDTIRLVGCIMSALLVQLSATTAMHAADAAALGNFLAAAAAGGGGGDGGRAPTFPELSCSLCLFDIFKRNG